MTVHLGGREGGGRRKEEGRGGGRVRIGDEEEGERNISLLPGSKVRTGVCVMLPKLSLSLVSRSEPNILSITGVCITSLVAPLFPPPTDPTPSASPNAISVGGVFGE